ncbi:transposase, partial [Escherichia coli]|nr:transposase [Escherichia coli]
REEVARLNQEIRRRQMELDILKKAEKIIKNLWSPPFLLH